MHLRQYLRATPLLLLCLAGTGCDDRRAAGDDDDDDDQVAADAAPPTADAAEPAPDGPAPVADDWWRHLGDDQQDRVGDVAIAASGDVVIAGLFGGPGAGDSAVAPRSLVAAYTSAGTLRWQFPSVGTARATGVALDGDGNAIVVGSFRETIDLGDGPLTSTGQDEIFVAKLDSAGALLWSRRRGGTSFDRVSKVAVDAAGNALLAWTETGVLNIARLAPDGEELWSHALGAVFNNLADLPPVYDVTTDDAGDLYLAGSFYGSADLGGEPLVSAGGADVFVAAYAAVDGAHRWSFRQGTAVIVNSGGDEALGIAIAGDDLVICGQSWGPSDLGGGALPGGDGWNAFLARYARADGAYRASSWLGDGWATRVAVAGDEAIVLAETRAPRDPAIFAPSIAGYDLADGAFRRRVVLPASGELAVSADGHTAVAAVIYGDVVAGGEPVPSFGQTDVLLGRIATP